MRVTAERAAVRCCATESLLEPQTRDRGPSARTITTSITITITTITITITSITITTSITHQPIGAHTHSRTHTQTHTYTHTYTHRCNHNET